MKKIFFAIFLILSFLWILVYLGVAFDIYINKKAPLYQIFLIILLAILPPIFVYKIGKWIRNKGIKDFKIFIKNIFSDIEKFNKSAKKKKMVSNYNKLNQNDVFWIAPAIVLIIGLFPLPIGYYTLTRLVVCGCAFYYAFNLYKKKENTLTWIFGFLVVLYNPVIPVYLYEKAIWVFVNIITIFAFYKYKDKIK